jgi:hypothetical protein
MSISFRKREEAFEALSIESFELERNNEKTQAAIWLRPWK